MASAFFSVITEAIHSFCLGNTSEVIVLRKQMPAGGMCCSFAILRKRFEKREKPLIFPSFSKLQTPKFTFMRASLRPKDPFSFVSDLTGIGDAGTAAPLGRELRVCKGDVR